MGCDRERERRGKENRISRYREGKREREKEIDIGRNVYGGSYFFRFTTWYARGAASL